MIFKNNFNQNLKKNLEWNKNKFTFSHPLPLPPWLTLFLDGPLQSSS